MILVSAFTYVLFSNYFTIAKISSFLYTFVSFGKGSRLNNNSLTGSIPMSLTNISSLQVL